MIGLLRRFQETSYLVPRIFIDRVTHFFRYYTAEPVGRRDVELAVRNGRHLLPMIKRLLEEKKLPAELAYLGFVESKFDRQSENPRTGAKGIWQLLPGVAREQGLVVDERNDERTDPLKSTLAARGLLLQLIAVYGVRSFMLALAAYNAGDVKIRARLKRLPDPIEQRDFWTLARLGLLAEETHDYIPKFVAATIVFENLERFGFSSEGT